jgi:hypothetical protein
MSEKLPYDIAVSFAGEHRDYVEATVRACQDRGLRVFYDRDKNNEWWGGNFIRQQRSVYSSQTRYFVPFLSQEYVAKPIPMDEFSSAMMTAVRQGDGYILPVLMDGVDVPPELLHPHIHYLSAKDYTPEQLANELVRKVGQAAAAGQEAQAVGGVVERALAVRMPKIIPANWSKYEQLEVVFSYLGRRFKEAADQMRAQQLLCTVRTSDDQISVRVERGGETVAGLDVSKGRHMGDDHLTWSLSYRNPSNSFNGWASPTYDKESGLTLMEVSDMANVGREDRRTSYEGFFEILWDKVVDQVERR